MAGNSYRFPSDLLDSPEYGAMIQFSAYTAQSSIGMGAQPTAPGLSNLGTGININGTRKLQDTFQLYMPGGGQNSLTFAQRHDYDDVKMSRIGAGIMSSIVGIGADKISGANALMGGLFRVQINPGVEVLYRGTDIAAFVFSFLFAPQNQSDSDMLYGTNNDGILNRFRYYAAPEIGGTANLAFFSPSEWEIDFWIKDANGGWRQNDKIPKIAKGVLTRVEVDYNPDSEFSTFEDGSSVTSRLTMQFVEMQIVDKKLIGQGY